MSKKLRVFQIKRNKSIPQGKYTAHIEHFPNQAEGVFAFIIDKAEDAGLIGKGVSQRFYSVKAEDE